MNAALRERLHRWAVARADDDLLRAMFATILTATVAVLVMDYAALSQQVAAVQETAPSAAPQAMPGGILAAEPDDGKNRDDKTAARRCGSPIRR